MRIAVTGPNGFIGSSLIPLLEEAGHVVIRLGRQDLAAYRERAERDLLPEVDAFLHLAWAGSMGAARGDLRVQFRNLALSLEMVNLAKAMNAKTFVGVGTITEVDALLNPPSKDSRPGAAQVYGEAKLLAERLTRVASAQAGLSFMWFRLGNIVAPGDKTGRFFISTLQTLMENEAVTFNSSGEQLIDFMDQRDANTAMLRALEAPQDGAVVYVGAGTPAPLKERVATMKEVLGSTSSIAFTGDPATEKGLPRRAFTPEVLISLGFVPATSFEALVEAVAAGEEQG